MTGDPVGLYIHAPFCDGKCRYCAFYSVPYDDSLAARWLNAVRAEFARHFADRPIPRFETVYIGGGTPTLLAEGLLAELGGWIRSLLPPGVDVEWSVEANPCSAFRCKLERLRAAGANRISLGAQSFDDRRLSILGRRHTAAQIAEAAAAARDAGFRNMGLDLIAGGPGAGPGAWRRTLERALALGPEHVSVYALTAEEGTALAEAVRMGKARISESAAAERLHEARRILESAGYRRYEISNYARPGFACRHHLACWRGARYLGLGPAAASHVGMRRWTNAPDVLDYVERLESGRDPAREEETLSPETKAAELLVFGLRMAEGVDLDAIARRGGAEALQRWTRVLEEYRNKGMAERSGSRWRLTTRGMDFADAVAVDLL